MSREERIRIENERLETIEFANKSGSHRGCIRISAGVTKEHEQRKFDICYELGLRGYSYLTEIKFKSGGRADVLDVTNGIIYEVLHTEDMKTFREKIKKYPEQFEVRPIKSRGRFIPKMID